MTVKRLTRLWSIARLSHSWTLIRYSLKYRQLAAVAKFLRSGGQILTYDDKLLLRWQGIELTIYVHQLWSLIVLLAMQEYGWLLKPHQDGRYLLTIPGQAEFVVHQQSLASDLMVIYERFLEDEYGIFPVADHIVIDIGANIGDSAIYFALKGAEVHAFEPFSQPFQQLMENIQRNHLEKMIFCHCFGLSASSQRLLGRYNPCESLSSTLSGPLMEINENIQGESEEVDTVSLGEVISIVRRISGRDKRIVLKLDCEGCEFDIVNDLSLSFDDLQQVDAIIIEYHHRSPQNMILTLNARGFKLIRVVPKGPVGLLYFSRNEH